MPPRIESRRESSLFLNGLQEPSPRPWRTQPIPDFQDFPGTTEKVPPLELRPRNIIPSLERILDKPVLCSRSAKDSLQEEEPGQDLDVEGPRHPKGRTEYLSQSLGVPEDLRPAL